MKIHFHRRYFLTFLKSMTHGNYTKMKTCQFSHPIQGNISPDSKMAIRRNLGSISPISGGFVTTNSRILLIMSGLKHSLDALCFYTLLFEPTISFTLLFEPTINFTLLLKRTTHVLFQVPLFTF